MDADSHLHRIITNFMILDLERPEVVLGKGFHRLLLSIENPASVPNVPILVDEILPKKFNQVKNVSRIFLILFLYLFFFF